VTFQKLKGERHVWIMRTRIVVSLKALKSCSFIIYNNFHMGWKVLNVKPSNLLFSSDWSAQSASLSHLYFANMQAPELSHLNWLSDLHLHCGNFSSELSPQSSLPSHSHLSTTQLPFKHLKYLEENNLIIIPAYMDYITNKC